MPARQDGAAEGLARAKGALMREAEADQVRGGKASGRRERQRICSARACLALSLYTHARSSNARSDVGV